MLYNDGVTVYVLNFVCHHKDEVGHRRDSADHPTDRFSICDGLAGSKNGTHSQPLLKEFE